MKLRQKGFLCTLVLVLLAIDVTATAVMMTLFASKQEKAASGHTTLCAALSGNLLLQRLRQGAVLFEPYFYMIMGKFRLFSLIQRSMTRLRGMGSGR